MGHESEDLNLILTVTLMSDVCACILLLSLFFALLIKSLIAIQIKIWRA